MCQKYLKYTVILEKITNCCKCVSECILIIPEHFCHLKAFYLIKVISWLYLWQEFNIFQFYLFIICSPRHCLYLLGFSWVLQGVHLWWDWGRVKDKESDALSRSAVFLLLIEDFSLLSKLSIVFFYKLLEFLKQLYWVNLHIVKFII